MKNIIRSTKLIYKTIPGAASALVVIIILYFLSYPLNSFIDKFLFDKLQLGYATGFDFRAILYVIALYFIYNLMFFVLDKSKEHINNYASIKFSAKLQNRCMRGISQIDYEKYENNTFYNYLTTITREIQGGNVLKLFQNTISLVGVFLGLIYLCAIQYRLGIIPLVISVTCCIPGFLHQGSFGKKNWEFNTSKIPLKRKTEYIFSLLSSVGVFKENKIYNTTDHYKSKYHALFQDYYNELQAFNGKNCWKGVLMATIHSLGTVGVIAYAYYKAAMGHITLGDAVMFVGITQNIYFYVQNAVFFTGENSDAKRSVDNLLSFESEITVNDENGEFNELSESLSIKFKGVKYAYPGGRKNVLDGINFEIKNNEKIAIVGENGSGKTTLAKILLGLYQPKEGTVEIENGQTGQKSLKYATVCFQDYCTYSFTLRENVGIGNSEKLYDDYKISQALNMSKLSLDIFHDNLECNITKVFDTDGIELSIGQSQKLALARAFMFEKGVIVLDEPSASLDVITENEIFESTLALMKNRPALIITHRLANVVNCDKILYLEDGIIIESGSHEELMKLQGRYYELFMIQAEKYK